VNVVVTGSLSKLPALKQAVADGARAVCAAAAAATAEEARGQLAALVPGPSVPGPGPGSDSIVIDGSSVVVNSDFAARLELGTSQSPARPFLGPASQVGGEAAASAVADLAQSLGQT
jgi:hypothetical protein